MKKIDNEGAIMIQTRAARIGKEKIRVEIIPTRIVRSYIITMRPYLMFVSGITGIAGLAALSEAPLPQLVLVSIACFLSYGFGQALTDCFQTDTDAISSPYRPLIQGAINKRQIMAISLIGLSICVSILAIYNNVNILFGLAAGLGLATYTPFKRTWWGGPFYNAWIVALLCLMAYATGFSSFNVPMFSSLAPTLIVVFFGYANFVLSGYFKDIEADRATGYYTLPVVFGRSISAIVSDIFAGLQIVASLTALSMQQRGVARLIPALALCIAGIVASLTAQIRLHRVRSDGEAHRAISLVVHSYILLLSGIACAEQPSWVPAIILFYCAFIVVLSVRPEKSQI